MTNEELGSKMIDEVPEAGPYFWSRVNAALKQIEILEDFSETDVAEEPDSAEQNELTEPDSLDESNAPLMAVPQKEEAETHTEVMQNRAESAKPALSVVSDEGGYSASQGAPKVQRERPNTSHRSRYLLATAAAVVLLAGGVIVFQYNNLFGSSGSDTNIASNVEESAANYEADSALQAEPATRSASGEESVAADSAQSFGPEADLAIEEESSMGDTVDADEATEQTTNNPLASTVTSRSSTTISEKESAEDVELDIIASSWFTNLALTFDAIAVKEIKFAPGSTYSIEVGSLEANQMSIYYLNALEGQRLSASVAGDQELFVEIFDVEGISVANGFSSIDLDLLASGRYYVVVNTIEAAGAYELVVEII